MKNIRAVNFAILLFFLKFFSWVMFGLKIRGLKNVPRKGGVLIVSNHISNFDPVIAGISAPRELSYMAKKELFKNFFLRNLIKLFKAFPVNRTGVVKDAFEKAFKVLRQGDALLIFPEGTRGDGKYIKDAKPGTGMIIYKAKPKVVPLIILGTDKVLPKNKKSFHFCKISTFFGKPIDLERFFKMTENKETYGLISAEITLALNDLLKTSTIESGSQ